MVRVLVIVVAVASLNDFVFEVVAALLLLDIAFTPSRKTGIPSAVRMGLTSRQTPKLLAAGFALGAAEMSLVIGVMAVSGWYRVSDLRFRPGMIVGYTVFFFGVSLFEELTDRGWILYWFERWTGSLAAVLLSSLVFGLLHLANPGSGSVAVIALALGAGVELGGAYLATGSLWFPVGLHWSWNLFEGTVYGTPVSGTMVPSIVHAKLRGPTLWTGDEFGPESGLLVLVTSAGIGVAMLVVAHRRGRLRSAAEARAVRASSPRLTKPEHPSDAVETSGTDPPAWET